MIEERRDSLELIGAAVDLACERAEKVDDEKMRPVMIVICGEPNEPPCLRALVGEGKDLAAYIAAEMLADEDFANMVMCALGMYKGVKSKIERK